MPVPRRRRSGKTTWYATYYVDGVQQFERVGTDKREAERVERQRRREVADGTYVPSLRTSGVTIARYAEEWGAARTNRSAADDRQRVRDHFVSRYGTMRMRDFDERRALEFVRALAQRVQAGDMAARTARNIRGVVRTMFGWALVEQVVPANPFAALPRGLLPRPARVAREVYTPAEVAVLTGDERIAAPLRVLLALMLYTGMRQGEACGRRWRDWDRATRPLGCLSVHDQYDSRPLKTDTDDTRPRMVPVHPELARVLTWWRDEGWQLTSRRPPQPEDWIVPTSRLRPHTKSSSYKALMRALARVELRWEGCHLTRHTMVTYARRGGARSEVLETVTHNAAGAIIDGYTHWHWVPLCEAVLALDVTVSIRTPWKELA